MTKEAINEYLDELEHWLLNASAVISVEVSSTWVNQFPEEAAVFILREDDAIVYVSETGNLKNKMAELVSDNHFEDDMSGLLNDIIAKHLKLSYLLVDLGRKELEERILERISASKKTYTKAGKQQSHKNAYEKWTTEDDEKLELLFCEGKTVKELSAIFERNEGSINSRIKKLELREKYDR
ncbi:hypothetical protein [Niabella drilacis]|uniref:Uncharacterized protein n=1 Tax=Niabella drilacis (strain DSM 25811 / CCM 8410 / CCUG 62505 / LMG 26954 / E90) TaxID=1285928 RepID=A0A1G6WG11_NIADE|nr:hypothetical protein [Niabella drilacis]SDD63996.1 hypothetical protein SAMN04487894_11194 [Niabella drilacis]